MPRTGYKTTGPTGGGNAAVVFAIDKSGFYKGIKETGEALDAMQKRINREIKNVGYGSSGKVTVTVSDNKLFSAEIIRGLESALEDATDDFAKELARSGKQFFRNIVKTAPNRRKAPGRIDTGLMLGSVQGRTRKTKNVTYIGVGWNVVGNSPYYRYFSFQEDGTAGGALPMRAVPQTATFLSQQFNGRMNKDLKTRLDNIK